MTTATTSATTSTPPTARAADASLAATAGDGWTDARVAALRDFWGEGHATAEIGRLGVGKNAVVGKAHRLNLSARPNPLPAGAAAGGRRATPQGTGRHTGEPPGVPAPTRAWTLPRPTRPAPDAATTPAGPTAAAVRASCLTKHAATPPSASARAAPPRPAPAPRPLTLAEAPPQCADRADRDGTDGDVPGAGRGCRWPLGEPRRPGFRFCGDPTTAPGRPYCEAHHRAAHEGPGVPRTAPKPAAPCKSHPGGATPRRLAAGGGGGWRWT